MFFYVPWYNEQWSEFQLRITEVLILLAIGSEQLQKAWLRSNLSGTNCFHSLVYSSRIVLQIYPVITFWAIFCALQGFTMEISFEAALIIFQRIRLIFNICVWWSPPTIKTTIQHNWLIACFRSMAMVSRKCWVKNALKHTIKKKTIRLFLDLELVRKSTVVGL